MHGYCIVRLAGVWKYTCSVIPSRSVWSSSREAIVHLPQTQEKTGGLDFYILHSPEHPRPLNVTNGEVLLICISISHDADRITGGDVGVYLITNTKESPI